MQFTVEDAEACRKLNLTMMIVITMVIILATVTLSL